MAKFVKFENGQVQVIDGNYNFITTQSWLDHLESLSSLDLLKGINFFRSILKNTLPTVDHDLAYEKHLLLTFSWKFTHKQQLTINFI